MASTEMAPMATNKKTALKRAAKIDELLYPYVYLSLALFCPSQIASQELPGMSLRELFMILLLVVLLVLLGFYPQPILDTSHSAIGNIQQWFVNSVTTTRP